MIRRDGPQSWSGVHVTHTTTVADLINVDNTGPQGLYAGFEMFRQAGASLDGLIREARDAGEQILAIGSGWALTEINITHGRLVNTKLLNGCYDLGERWFDPAYPAADRGGVVLAQGGVQIAELNAYLELLPDEDSKRRALKAAGIGNGQTIAGAVAGNTHGSQLTYGAMPDAVVGLHIATGRGTLWIEKASKPVLSPEFCAELGAELIRDDDVFNAAVVSFGTFGIIAAMALETAPIYQLEFGPIRDIAYDDLKAKLRGFGEAQEPDLYHYEFIFDPHSKARIAAETFAPKVPYKPNVPTPTPRWILRDKKGFAPGISLLRVLGLFRAFVPPGLVTRFEFKQYRKLALLNSVRGSPGQIYTASIYYLEGYTESAFAVAVKDAPETIDIICAVARAMKLPSISQVRIVKGSQATLGFTRHQPRTAVFEVGLINDERFPEFERRMDAAFRKAGIRYTLHWSKNSGITPDQLDYMYGADRIARWKAARIRVFGGDEALMRTCSNPVLVSAGLG